MYAYIQLNIREISVYNTTVYTHYITWIYVYMFQSYIVQYWLNLITPTIFTNIPARRSTLLFFFKITVIIMCTAIVILLHAAPSYEQFFPRRVIYFVLPQLDFDLKINNIHSKRDLQMLIIKYLLYNRYIISIFIDILCLK